MSLYSPGQEGGGDGGGLKIVKTRVKFNKDRQQHRR